MPRALRTARQTRLRGSDSRSRRSLLSFTVDSNTAPPDSRRPLLLRFQRIKARLHDRALHLLSRRQHCLGQHVDDETQQFCALASIPLPNTEENS